ncbi:hypothetical protein OG711_35445 [Streptomyces uncialis]|uniref:hypothetical protein n=1 Tax=Streptomyces uncialis TaxID=1048205 RepID=UPI002E3089FC|nr:hypothetical protein [Streptomyces uncialis]
MTARCEPRAFPSRSRSLGRALLGGLVMATSLGAGTAVGSVLTKAAGLDGVPARLVSAALVSAIATPLVLLAARRARLPARLLGTGGPRAMFRAFLAGSGVMAAAAALVMGAATAAGLLRWSAPDLVTLAGFLVTNGVVALLLEAWPEEVTLRGYTWAALRERFRGLCAGLATTVVFLLVPGASTVVRAVVGRALGEDEVPPLGLAPPGQSTADYLILLAVFGSALVVARTAVPGPAPLGAAIGAHLVFLTVNRVVFDGEARGAGWSAELSSPDAALLVPAYLLVAVAGFRLYRRVRPPVPARRYDCPGTLGP